MVHRKGSYPCGKCLNCRIAKSREWSLRLMNELGYWNKSVFLTLTYDDEHLPEDHSLHKEELQKFFKRLRKNYGEPIKYFACGEYGSKVTTLYDENGQGKALGRPHYHAIIFGIDKTDKEVIKQSWTKCNWNMFQDKNVFGSVTYDSCRYVSDYIFKKYDNKLALSEYGNRQVPFKIGSNGLGLSFVKDNAKQLKTLGYTTVRGVKVNLPRYYRLKLGIKDSVGDRFERSKREVEKWQNYCKRFHKDSNSIADFILESRIQRKINTERNAELHKKGSI